MQIADVVRLSDRLFDKKDPNSIDRAGSLTSLLVAVFIFHAVLFIGFLKMEEIEKKHKRIIHDVDVQMAYAAPPPDPTFKVGEIPRPISLTEGDNPNPGSEAAPKPAKADTTSLPTIKAPETAPTQQMEQAKPVQSRITTVAPPVAVTSTNVIKAVKAPQIKQAPTKAPAAPTVGAASTQQASGSPTAGGTADGVEGGIGTGGAGQGGAGTGEGDPGSGSGFGTSGGEIATATQKTTRPMGNIAPYRKDLLVRIAHNWTPKRKSENIIVLLTLNHDGGVISTEILQSSGNKRADKEALSAIESTEYAALPEWYKGESLTFKIELAKVEALK